MKSKWKYQTMWLPTATSNGGAPQTSCCSSFALSTSYEVKDSGLTTPNFSFLPASSSSSCFIACFFRIAFLVFVVSLHYFSFRECKRKSIYDRTLTKQSKSMHRARSLDCVIKKKTLFLAERGKHVRHPSTRETQHIITLHSQAYSAKTGLNLIKNFQQGRTS